MGNKRLSIGTIILVKTINKALNGDKRLTVMPGIVTDLDDKYRVSVFVFGDAGSTGHLMNVPQLYPDTLRHPDRSLVWWEWPPNE